MKSLRLASYVTSFFTIVILSTLPANAVGSLSFTDVDTYTPYYQAIDYLHNSGIVNGFSDGSFRPNRTISRGEFTKILINTKFKDQIINCNDNFFPDVTNSNKFHKEICVAKNQNIIRGYSDGTFKPEFPISYNQAFKIVSNTYGFTTGAQDIKTYFEALASKNAIPPVGFLNDYMQRNYMAEMIYRLENQITTSPSSLFQNVNSDSNRYVGRVISINRTSVKFEIKNCYSINIICEPNEPKMLTEGQQLTFPISQSVILTAQGYEGDWLPYVKVGETYKYIITRGEVKSISSMFVD